MLTKAVMLVTFFTLLGCFASNITQLNLVNIPNASLDFGSHPVIKRHDFNPILCGAKAKIEAFPVLIMYNDEFKVCEYPLIEDPNPYTVLSLQDSVVDKKMFIPNNYIECQT